MDDLNEYEVGQPMDEPMTEEQRNRLYHLIYSAILSPDQKEGYKAALDCNLTYNEAAGLEQELRQIQLNPLDKVKPYKSEVDRELRRLVNRPNT